MAIYLDGTNQALMIGGLGNAVTYGVNITIGTGNLPNGVRPDSDSGYIVSTAVARDTSTYLHVLDDFMWGSGGCTLQVDAGTIWSSGQIGATGINGAVTNGSVMKIRGITTAILPLETSSFDPPIATGDYVFHLFGAYVSGTQSYNNCTEVYVDSVELLDSGGSTLATFDLSTPAPNYSNNGYDLVVANYSAVDDQPPVFTSAPAVTATSGTGHTITMTADEDCTIYGVQLPVGATSPSAAQVKAGTDGGGNAALSAINEAALSTIPKGLTFTGGAVSTQYQYFFSAEDGAGNLQAAASNVVLAVTGAGSIAITGGTLTAGSAFAGTYTGISSISSPITLTDSQGNTLNVAITDAGSGNFSGTMPALPTSGSSSSILFGTVTVSGGE